MPVYMSSRYVYICVCVIFSVCVCVFFPFLFSFIGSEQPNEEKKKKMATKHKTRQNGASNEREQELPEAAENKKNEIKLMK